MSGLLNKVKQAVVGDKHDGAHDGTHGHGHGTHTSSTGMGSDTTTSGAHTGTTGGMMSGTSTTSEPHSSAIMNKADPRIDSDNDGRTALGGTSTGTGSTTGGGLSGMMSGGQSAMTGTSTTTDDRTRLGGMGSSGTGMSGTSSMGTSSTGTTGTSTGLPPFGATPSAPIHGHHTTITAEVLDPHVGQSGVPGGTGMTGNTTGSSTTTSGPHNSSILNKIDPRVDSDGDGKRMS